MSYSDGKEEDHQLEHRLETNDLPDELDRAQDGQLLDPVLDGHVLVGDEELDEMERSFLFVRLFFLVVAVLALEQQHYRSDQDKDDAKHVVVV